MPPPKVLIVGAGIAGPALAFWLSRIGCDMTIIERDAALRDSGQQVDLRGQGIVLMRKMGMEAAVRAVLCDEPGTQIVDRRGRQRAYFPANKTGKGNQSATSEYEFMRGDFVRILHDATEGLDGVKYRFGLRVECLVQREGSSGVQVVFSDQTREAYDLVVGADGVGSPTRRLMLGPSFPDPRHDMGAHAAFFTIPARKDDPRPWTACHLPGRRLVMTRKDRPESLRVSLVVHGDCEELDAADKSASKEDQKRAWAQRFDAFRDYPPMPRFLDGLLHAKEADDLYTQHMSQIRLPEGCWSRGGVVLIGDAAYCPTPMGGGLGTTAALVGAYVLAGEVASRWREAEGEGTRLDFGDAARAYERLVRPFVTEAQNVPPLSWLMLPETEWGIWILQTVAWVFSVVRVEKLFGWLSPEESDELTFPDYPALAGDER
ncbi:hypothetical protein J3459_015267 [Metarhizium acridum]|nr:hypothetical protein J3459_015267 [Metarhizium acridum]